MNTRLTFLFTFALMILGVSQAHAADVAVMPVEGVNLAGGQCDAIGVLFGNAYARELNVSTASPAETAQARERSPTSQAAAAQLGVSEYVELRAIQLGAKVTLAGIRYAKDGTEIFRAETAAPSLDEIDVAVARLARALAWRRPIPRVPPRPPVTESAETPPPVVEVSTPKGYPKALGVKAGLIVPVSLGRAFLTAAMLEFDARFGTRDYFIELGLGFAGVVESHSATGKAALEGLFTELGASFYLSNGDFAPYLGGGISPRIASINGSSNGISGVIYGQAGVTLTRDSRARIYVELRVSQNLIGIPEYANDGSTTPDRTTLGVYHPTEFALQFGLGW